MKKQYLLFIIIFLFSFKIHSQIIQGYGIKLGYVNSSQSFNNSLWDEDTKRKNGYSISAFIALFNLSGFSISPEVKYIQKGVGIEFIVTGEDSPEPIGTKTEYIYHNYLSIPISLMYKIQLEIGSPFFKAAPRYDILLKSSDDFKSPASTYDDYKNVFGGTISIGFIPKFDSLIIPFIEFSYHIDFTYTYSNIFEKIKNNAFEINLGVLYY